MEPLFDSQFNKIVLKPRFKVEHNEKSELILEKFTNAFAEAGHSFRGKVVGDHVVIDVAESEEHFWSPQLQLEIEELEKGSIIKGLFGPKPQLWTLFMFIHFGVALAFAIFLTKLYTDISLDQDYTFSLVITLVMPVLWILFYLFGRWGKKKGHHQMIKLNDFMIQVLNS